MMHPLLLQQLLQYLVGRMARMHRIEPENINEIHAQSITFGQTCRAWKKVSDNTRSILRTMRKPDFECNIRTYELVLWNKKLAHMQARQKDCIDEIYNTVVDGGTEEEDLRQAVTKVLNKYEREVFI